MTIKRKQIKQPATVKKPAAIEKKTEGPTLTPVGASNPYALARLIAEKRGEGFDWAEIPEGDVKGKLSEYLGAPYENLFDPSLCLALYMGILPMPVKMMGDGPHIIGRSDLLYDINPIRDAIINQALKKAGMKMTGVAVPGEPSLSLSATTADSVKTARISAGIKTIDIPSWTLTSTEITGTGAQPPTTAVPTIWKGITAAGYNFTYRTPTLGFDIHKDIIDDIQQGALPDCFFLAAMGAFNWVNTVPTTTIAISSTYSVVLHNRDGLDSTNTVSNELPLPNDSSISPVYAAVTPQKEVYPAIYEKAYAKLRDLGNSTVPSASGGTNPDVSKLTGGIPLDALQAISGKSYHWEGSPITAYYTVSPAGAPDTGIDNTNDNNPRYTNFKNQFDSYGKTISPMVAWTYYTGGNQTAPSDRINAPADVRYVADWMVANHAYTVLGFKTLNSIKYIILRNPFGRTYGGIPNMNPYPPSPNPPVITDPDGIYNAAYAWRMSSSNYTLNIGQVQGADRKLKPDGIFALKFEYFLHYFEAVGWVV